MFQIILFVQAMVLDTYRNSNLGKRRKTSFLNRVKLL